MEKRKKPKPKANPPPTLDELLRMLAEDPEADELSREWARRLRDGREMTSMKKRKKPTKATPPRPPITAGDLLRAVIADPKAGELSREWSRRLLKGDKWWRTVGIRQS